MLRGEQIESYRQELESWRRDFHRHPELAFEEERTSNLVAQRLESFGVEVHRGLARTGVVGVLRSGSSSDSVALRADMDALPIHEESDLPYRSIHDGKMHACGHDGHTTMLLGAARYLAETRRFDGTVYLIFQPAEENEGGARAMIEDGLFERFPAHRVFGMHNFPGLQVGRFALCPGPMMAAYDRFEIDIRGRGAHAARPQDGVDAILVGAQVVQGLQAIVARNVDPMKNAVVSVTQICGGDTWNVLPESVRLRGCTRSFAESVRSQLEDRILEVAKGICAAHGAQATVRYERGYPPTVNKEHETRIAAAAAARVVGESLVSTEMVPIMGSEDFAFMLQERPGAYIGIGNTGNGRGKAMLHNPRYDFNDDALTVGVEYWAELAESQLGTSAAVA
jgi:hippurate hydrolase